MKVLTLAFVLAAFCALSLDAGRCFTRKEKVNLKKLMEEMKCTEPMEQLVQLPVPKGYSYVVPSMSKVKRCSGFMCWGKNKGCMPTMMNNKTIKVEAFTSDESMKCMEVEVVEHIGCGCQCSFTEENCSENQVFDSEMCHCDKCREGAMVECMNRKGGRDAWMFNENGCTCICSDPIACGSYQDGGDEE